MKRLLKPLMYVGIAVVAIFYAYRNVPAVTKIVDEKMPWLGKMLSKKPTV